MKIYLAGPLFTRAEVDFNKSLAERLRVYGHEVFLPQEHAVGEGPWEIFQTDREGMDAADVIVANLDGADGDSGTSFEVGYNYGKKPIICYRTDLRKDDQFSGNLMAIWAADIALNVSATHYTVARIAVELDQAIENVR